MGEGERAAPLLRASALAALVLGAFLLLGSWDGLYDTLDLPQGLPAVTTQLGGAAFAGLAYLLWSAAARPELVLPAAVAGAIAEGGSAVVIGAWLAFRDPQEEIGIDSQGTAILCVVIVVLALLAIGLAYVARSLRATR